MKKLAIGLLLSFVLSAPALSQECTSKLQGFVNKTGYKIKVAKPCAVWAATDALTIPRGEGATGLLLIAQEGEMAIVGVVVESKANLHLSSDLLLQLMKMNNELEFVKVGIDNDGDLFIRTELHMPSLTEADFKVAVKNVVAGSAQIYAILKK